jgi:putative transposase
VTTDSGSVNASKHVAATFRSPDCRLSESQPPFRWRRKTNRLPRKNYLGANAYLVTCTTDDRKPRFKDAELVDVCVAKLTAACELEQAEILAYVFMPDHTHLLLLASEKSDLARLMKRMKQETAFGFTRRTGEVLWQKSYHDHILRRDEDLNHVARYLAANPVRAGIVKDWRSYPYTGGILLDDSRAGDLKVAATSAEAPA